MCERLRSAIESVAATFCLAIVVKGASTPKDGQYNSNFETQGEARDWP